MLQVKLFDKEHEKDLEVAVNRFLKKLDEEDVVDIKYQVTVDVDRDEQVYCFSAMIIYKA
ncbi:sporulation protein Cse60 [Priestia megaterium]|nr:sporulation protein Cse60 [Priestia megaterium]